MHLLGLYILLALPVILAFAQEDSWEFGNARTQQDSRAAKYLGVPNGEQEFLKYGTVESERSPQKPEINAHLSEQSRSMTFQNTSKDQVDVYLVFPDFRNYSISDFINQGCVLYINKINKTLQDRCKLTVPKGPNGKKMLSLDKGGVNVSGGLGNEPAGDCPTTMFEINVSPPNDKNNDSYDVSLVNGFNYSAQIIYTRGESTTFVTKAKGHRNSRGVYPLGCTLCIFDGSVPPIWDNCPGSQNPTKPCNDQCISAAECKTGPNDKNPNAPCHFIEPTGGSYTVKIADPE